MTDRLVVRFRFLNLLFGPGHKKLGIWPYNKSDLYSLGRGDNDENSHNQGQNAHNEHTPQHCLVVGREELFLYHLQFEWSVFEFNWNNKKGSRSFKERGAYGTKWGPRGLNPVQLHTLRHKKEHTAITVNDSECEEHSQ